MLTVSGTAPSPAGWKWIASTSLADALGDMRRFVRRWRPARNAANSSPPMRPIVSPPRTPRPMAAAMATQRLVADQMAEAVIDLLEVVGVDEQQRAAVDLRREPSSTAKKLSRLRKPVIVVAARLLGKRAMRLGEFGMGGRQALRARGAAWRSARTCRRWPARPWRADRRTHISQALPSTTPPSAGTTVATIDSDAATAPIATSDDFRNMLRTTLP